MKMAQSYAKFQILIYVVDVAADNETAKSDWMAKLFPSPAGSRGMIAPEAFLRDNKGRKVLTTKLDVWSASTTMMHVLEGKYKNQEQLKEFATFFKNINVEFDDITYTCKECIQIVQDQALEINTLTTKLEKIEKFLKHLKEFQVENDTDIKKLLHEKREPETNPEKGCPVAEILTTVYRAQKLPQVCRETLPFLYENPKNSLSTTLDKICEIIQKGLLVDTNSRLTATEMFENLTLLSVDINAGLPWKEEEK